MELVPTGRFEWERIVHRIVMPKPQKLLALVLAGHADPDGSRVRPGNDRLAAITGDSEKNVRRILGVLRDDLGLVKVAKRGGGRWGTGRATEYQLTIPVDLLERMEVLDPDCSGPLLSGHPMSGHSDAEPAVDEVIRPDIWMSSHKTESPVDNSDDDASDRTSDAPAEPMTGHPEPSERTSECPTTSHDQPPKETNCGPDPAQPQTARDAQTTNEPSSKAAKCEHGLRLNLRPDGTPNCPCCRRGFPATLRLVEETSA